MRYTVDSHRTPVLLERVAAARGGILLALVVAAIGLRILLVVYSPTPFGYVYDYYHEAVDFLWQTGHLPIASDCWQCYHPPLYYVLGLPFYALGRWLASGLENSEDWGLRLLCALPLVAGAVTTLYSAKLVDRLVPHRGLSTTGIALVFAFPCLFISSDAPEADIVVTACMTAFLFYLTHWMTVERAGWRWPFRVGALAGLAAAAKYSGLIALATAGVVLGLRLLETTWRELRGQTPTARSSSPRPNFTSRSRHLGGRLVRIVRDGLVVLAVAVAVGGWKYVDNVRRFGTPLFANGSAGDAFSAEREYYWDQYDFTAFSPRAIVAVAQPGSPKGELTVLPVYREVWTTLYGMGWTDMSFFSVPGRISDPADPYPWKRIPPWLSGAVVYLALVPTAFACLGGLLLIRRRECLPLHVMLLLTLVSYFEWALAQDAWALKTKYILFLLPIYVTYAMAGIGWVVARVPRPAAAALIAAVIVLVIAAHAYQLVFALGHLPFA